MEKTKNMPSYYQQNKAILRQRIVERRRVVMNSERYIDARRPIY